MKTMTCKSLGGPCEQELSGGSWDEMVKAMTKHVMEKHPDTAKEMEKMHNEDPEKWGRETRPKPNTVHLTILMALRILILGSGLTRRGRSGKLLILRLTPRGFRRHRLDTTRSWRISSRTAL
jgi:predicted small metal-binding protein